MSANELKIDKIADEFEAAWGQGKRPSLKSFLDRVDRGLQVQLAELLIPIDAEYRCKAGEPVHVEDYATLDPAITANVERLLQSLSLTRGESSVVVLGETLDMGAAPVSKDLDATLDSPAYRSSNKNEEQVSRDPTKGEKGKSQTIGPYKLLQKLGEGGMGTVWMAEQEKPVRRRVALKVIKSGLNNKQVIARFEAERQAVAMMNHENIAKILDAGTTNTGQPYFVMELVQGIPFNKYCDQNKLSIKDRLELFIPVCKAVQHAHQKGIIHRDLKPTNVLVSLYDGKPVPKIIDFGLAKALQHETKLTDKTMFTEFGQVVGTLQYMSPEQAEMNQLDIDTRADIYSLGVMLYELLTGSTPIDQETMRGVAILKILESIRESEPPRPSVRLSSSTNEAVTGISTQRQIDAAKLKNILRGDLDWIVMKALEKDRTRRYESASGFAADVQRYLKNDPVIARPPSLTYRIKKFVRKNRAAVLAASLLSLALIAGIMGTTWGMLLASNRASGERIAKEKAQTLFVKEQASSQKALERLEQVKKIVEVLSSIFDDLDIRKEEASTEPIEERLAQGLVRASDQLDEQVVGNTAESAKLQSRLAVALLNLGYARKANRILDRWAEKLKKVREVSDPELQSIMMNHAVALTNEKRHEEAVAILEELKEWRENAGTLGLPEHLDFRANLVDALRSAGRTEEAIEMGENVVRDSIEMLGPDDYQTWLAKHALAIAYGKAKRNDDAIELHESFLPDMRSVMPNHPDTWTIMDGLAVEYSRNQQHDESIQLHKEALELKKGKLSPTHPSVATSMFNLSVGLCDIGRIEEGIAMGVASAELLEQRLGPTNDDTVFVKQALAKLYRRLNRINDAISLQESIFVSFEKAFGKADVRTLAAKGDLGLLFRDANRVDECRKYLEEVYAVAKNDPQLKWVKRELATTYVMKRDIKKLDELYPDIESHEVPLDDPAVSYEFIQLIEVRVDVCLQDGEHAKAKSLLAHCVELCKSSNQEFWKTGYYEFRLAEVFDETGNREKAKPLYIMAYEHLTSNVEEIPQRMRAKLLATSANRVASFAEMDDAIDQRHWREVSGTWLLKQKDEPIPEEVAGKVKEFEAELESTDDQYRVHNELRNLYFAFNEAKSFGHINAILKFRPMDKYMLDIITNHGAMDNELQANRLLAIAAKYSDSKYLKSAAMVQAAVLLGSQNSLSSTLLEKVSGTGDGDLSAYRQLALDKLEQMQE